MKLKGYRTPECKVFWGNALDVLENLPSHLVQCIVTSIPYYRKRDYGKDTIVTWPNDTRCQLGWENTVEEFVWHNVLIFREMYRVLRRNGILLLNIGDTWDDKKNLLGIPWSVAFGLRNDGWKLRSEIIWEITNSQPDSCQDRPGRCHETIFLFSRASRYYYDRDAVRQITGREASEEDYLRALGSNKGADADRFGKGYRKKSRSLIHPKGTNLRDVWRIPHGRTKGKKHYSNYPEEVVRRCILAGSRKGDIVLDPFCGTGTTGKFALEHGRRFVGIDLKKRFVKLTWANLMNTRRV